MTSPIERCSKCGAVIALVGRVHNCRPRAAAPVPVAGPKPKPKFGDAVNVPLSEMPARGIENALVHKLKSSRGGVDGHAAMAASAGDRVPDHVPRRTTSAQASGLPMVPPSAPAAGVEPGPREAKLRAKKGTYTHRDPEKRKAYMRGLMKTRRAKEPA